MTGTLWPMSFSLPSVSLPSVVAAAEGHTRELPMSPYAFGAVAFISFLALLGILWAFRGTAQKHAFGHATHTGHATHADSATHSDHQGSHH